MALSPVSGTTRRLAHPVSAEKIAENSDKGSDRVSPLKSSTVASSEHQSVSLADVLARQPAANSPVRGTTPSSSENSEAGGVNDTITQSFVESFSAAAADPKAFNEMLTSIFGDDIDQAQAEGFRQSALQKDFSFLPHVEYVDATVLQGGNGAYSADNNTIYINEELKGTELGEQTFVEEAGHFLDVRLNTSDTRGDEGEMFRRVLSGEALSEDSVDAIRGEDDSGTITVDGKQLNVEFWSLGGFISDVGDSIGNAVSGAADGISNAVNSVVDTVGDVVSNVAGAVGDVVTGVADSVGSAVSGAGNFVGGLLNTAGDAIGGDVGGFISSAGNGISSTANTVGNGISSSISWLNDNVVQPVINTGIELVQDVVPIVTGIATFPIQVAGNVISGAGNTFGLLLEGDFSGAWSSFGQTALDFVLAPAELAVTTIALAANAGVNAINNLFGLTEERGLNQEEIDYLKPIFGDSIDYSSIRIQSGGIKESVGISPQTTGNDIFLRQEWGGDIFEEDGTLTEAGLNLLGHEAGHVWQNQNGGITYVGDALITQGLDAIGIGSGYEIGEALQNGVAFENMNPEQQASVAEFIGIAIEANGSVLTAEEFAKAAGIPPMSDDEFAIVETAHDLLRA